MSEDSKTSLLDGLSRRQFMTFGGATLATFFIPKVSLAAWGDSHRTLALESIHTGEKVRTTYWERGRYIKGALQEINHVLRDHRTNDVHAMDPHLLDLLTALRQKLGSREKFEVISGYRSPQTNAMLHEHSNGVAKKSMHMEGKAIDIVLADRSLTQVRNAALSLGRGGVGYYGGKFVHVDTGPVRKW